MKREKIFAVNVFILSLTLSIGFFVFQDFFKEAKTLGLLGLFIINFVSNASFFISAPAMLTVFAAGNFYSPFLIAPVSSLGAAFGDSLSFLIGHSGRHILNHRLQKHILFRAIEDFFKAHGGWVLFIFSLVPNPIFDSIGLLAGIMHYSPVKFFMIIFIGRLIRFFFVAKFGSII